MHIKGSERRKCALKTTLHAFVKALLRGGLKLRGLPCQALRLRSLTELPAKQKYQLVHHYYGELFFFSLLRFLGAHSGDPLLTGCYATLVTEETESLTLGRE